MNDALKRRGSNGSLAREQSLQWDARSVTPAAILEAEITWRNNLGAQQYRKDKKKRSKSTGAARQRRRTPESFVWRAASPPGPKNLSFWGMIGRELNWGSSVQQADSTNRPSGHIANFLSVPLRMERFVMFGHLVAFDMFLFHFTWLPLRIVTSSVLGVLALCKTLSPASVWALLVSSLMFCSRTDKRRKSDSDDGWGHGFVFGHAQQYDLLKAIIIAVSTLVLGSVQLGRLYHYIRGEATIKLYVFFNILSVLDTLAASFGQDVLDVLLRSTRDAAGDVLCVDVFSLKRPSVSIGPGSRKHQRQALARLALYSVLAIIYVSIHAAVIFVQSVCLNVAINSRGNALLPLLVSSNFMELKSSVFKRYEAEQLFQISCSDAVERFVLSLQLVLVVFQQAPSSWEDIMGILSTVAVIWVFEVAVDFVKHAFITKYNRLSADLYGTFSSIIAHDVLSVRVRLSSSLDPTHATARRLGLATLPLACVVLRIAVTHYLPIWGSREATLVDALLIVLGFALLWGIKLLSSMCLLVYAAQLVRHQKRLLAKAVARQTQRAVPTPVASDMHVSGIFQATDAAPLPSRTVDLARTVSVGSSSVRVIHSSKTRRPSLTREGLSDNRIDEDDSCDTSDRLDKTVRAAFGTTTVPPPPPCSSMKLLRQRSRSVPTADSLNSSAARASNADGYADGSSDDKLMKTDVGLAARAECSLHADDHLTTAEQNLLLIGPLSHVERYSLTSRPMPM